MSHTCPLLALGAFTMWDSRCVRPDREDWAWCETNDLLGGAAEKGVRNAGASVRRHDGNIDILFVDVPDNLTVGCSFDDIDLHRDIGNFGGQFFEAGLGVAPRPLISVAVGAAQPVFDGVTPFDTTGATTSAALGDACSGSGPDSDSWFLHTATCYVCSRVST